MLVLPENIAYVYEVCLSAICSKQCCGPNKETNNRLTACFGVFHSSRVTSTISHRALKAPLDFSTPSSDLFLDSQHFPVINLYPQNMSNDGATVSRATSISRASKQGSTTSKAQSLIKKNIAPHDLRPSDILIERFVAWKAIVKQLIAYFEVRGTASRLVVMCLIACFRV